MPTLAETGLALLNPLEILWNKFVEFFPSFVSVIILLVIGYLLGLIIGHAIRVILQKAGLDRWLHKGELSRAIGKTHLSSVLGELVKWYIFIIFLQTSVELLDLGGLSDILSVFVNWLPNLLIAIIVVMFGMVLAHYVELRVTAHSKVRGVTITSKILKWVIIFMVVLIALRQIGVEVGILENAFLLVIGALAIGIALALGIGLGLGLKKDGEQFVQDIMKNF